MSTEVVHSAYISDDEHTKKVGKLQKIIYYLEEGNFNDSIDKIIGMGLTSDFLIEDLVRNIIRLPLLDLSEIQDKKVIY